MLATKWNRIVLFCHLLGSSPTAINGHLSLMLADKQNITKIFRRTNLKVAYKTRNTIEHLLNLELSIQDKCLKSGIYQLKYSDCNKKYVGQIGRSFYHMYKEHYQGFKSGNKSSNFARHLIDDNHPVVCVKIIHIIKKEGHMNTLEDCYIYNEKKIIN